MINSFKFYLFYKTIRWLNQRRPENMPCILLIGDSIRQGYAPYVKKSLGNNYIIEQPHENAQDTRLGLKRLRWWLGIKPRWDLIVFNWGLHDLKRPDHNSPAQVEIEKYKENLSKLANTIKSSSAKSIFMTTTPVPKYTTNRRSEDVEIYNNAAREVMNMLDIPVYDLNKFAQTHKNMHANAENENDVHFTDMGYEMLGGYIVNSILNELGAKTAAPNKTDQR